jgi:nucleotide-binding universal stress UspA family protein
MSIFPTRILLATDGSEEAQLALQTAVDLASSTGSELHVVTVGREYHPAYYEIPEPEEIREKALRTLEREAQGILDEQVRKIEEAGGAVTEVHPRMGGRRDQEIVRLSEEIGAGLIVMGSRGLGGLRRALMGSVSDSVVRHAHCPVLVVRKIRDTLRAGEVPNQLASSEPSGTMPAGA